MAQGQRQEPRILQCRMTDDDLEQSFEEWSDKHFESDSEAVRTALRQTIDDYEPRDDGQRAGGRVAAAAAVAVLVVAIGQTFLTAGGVPAAGLTLVALGAAGLGTQVPLERVVA